MQQQRIISSFEVTPDPKVGPTCTVHLVRGSQLSFRLCNRQLRMVSRQGYASKEEFSAACSLAGQQIRKAMRAPEPPPEKRQYSLTDARAPARQLTSQLSPLKSP